MRRNANKGKPLENALDIYHKYLLSRGEADITARKVETKLVGGKMVYTKKEGFDYQGTIRGGRSLCVEAKMSKKATLRVDPKNKEGLRLHQLQALVRNHKLGALVGVVWMMKPDEVYVVGGTVLEWLLDAFLLGKVKSITAAVVREHGENCIGTRGLVEYLPQLKDSENTIW